MLFGRRIQPTNCCSPALVISASACIACHVSGCLDYKFSHSSHCLDTIKCTYSAALQWMHGLHQSLYSSVAVWTTSLVASVVAWTTSSGLKTQLFSDCFDYKLSHISHCLNITKSTYSAARQYMFALQV
ncbi:hypothetical protein TNCV_419451 [Trichonephila clavipes]|uniref:Uncharacterized protein n=1 Tax=Trichonephila clavipes TaxID=2585209 RepID=A0A8X6VEQ2_TRICX|nr:hypothetical protein TNCV_419451 [Trichonephila clavipes]